jgi:Na+-driven multidrug efflux pump
MTSAAKTLLVFGIYVGILGLLVLLFPNILLRLFGAPPTNEIWIRVNGMFVICFSYYYIQAARHGVTPFIRWTVWGRATVIIYAVAFVLFAGAPKPLLLFGVIDLVCAAWTFLALRNDSAVTATP